MHINSIYYVNSININGLFPIKIFVSIKHFLIENFVISQMERLPDFSSIQGVIEKKVKDGDFGSRRRWREKQRF